MSTVKLSDQPNEMPSEQLPRYSAAGRPPTKGDRRAFLVWTILILLMIVITLGMYLFDKAWALFHR